MGTSATTRSAVAQRQRTKVEQAAAVVVAAGDDVAAGRSLKQYFKRFLQQEEGPTAVEYAVMLALIIVVCIFAIIQLGANANEAFTSVGEAISSSS